MSLLTLVSFDQVAASLIALALVQEVIGRLAKGSTE